MEDIMADKKVGEEKDLEKPEDQVIKEVLEAVEHFKVDVDKINGMSGCGKRFCAPVLLPRF